MSFSIPQYSVFESNLELNYLSEISQNRSYNFKYIKDDRICVIRNFDPEDGSLIPIHVKRGKIDPWVILRCQSFEFNNKTLEVAICNECNKDMSNLEADVNLKTIEEKLCLHSKVAGFLVRDFSNPYLSDDWLQLSEDFSEQGSKVEIIHERTCTTTQSQHLALVYTKTMLSLLWTQGRQLTPNCSNCSSKMCSCIRIWKKKRLADQKAFGVDDSNDETEPIHYCTAENPYGYNKKKITLPLINCPDQLKALESRDVRYSLPAEIIPEENETLLCKHGKQFSSHGVLQLLKKHVIVYHETGEAVIPCDVYGRQIPSCRCLQQCDLHGNLLYHLGHGVTVDYIVLQKLALLINKSGQTVQGYYNHLRDSAKALNKIYSCQYSQFLTAYNGFVRNFQWPKSVWSCPNCKNSPQYFVGDGKSLAPTQRALNRAGVNELRKHKDDNIILSQATHHKQRVFLSVKQDRDKVSALLHNEISIAEFLLYKGKSENFPFVHQIVEKFKDEEKLPDCYINFLAEVSKNTPVCGFIQVTERKSLSILRKFCIREVNLRDGNHQADLYKLRSEIPALWKNISEILKHENTSFLPKLVSNLIIQLLKIRIQTFSTAETRYQEDYFPYEEEMDDQCSFYPNFPLERHPKLYTVSSNVDRDACEKTFSSHTAFADGIFSIGCACELSITYGFELMMFAESPRHFFNFLTCREVDFNSLKGVIFDFACGLQRYVLNREPQQFEEVRFFIDGSHWTSKKKFNKDQNSAGGHLGCSSGYNFNIYKEFTSQSVNGAKNSQGREQMHSTLSKLSKSLRQMSYVNFMHHMIAFFAINNLHRRGEI